MSFVNDKLYNGYLRRKMPTIVSTVRVTEIMSHLPCLTLHDRETIEAKRETSGNYNGMVLLLDCLKRRESWPEQFINALEECEHTTIAAEVRAEYDALRGVNHSPPSPGSPPTTVVSAHVHPAPPACPLPVPESGASSQAAVALPAAAAAPPEPDARASPPLEPLEPPMQPQVPEAASPPEPVPESAPVEVAARPSTPPESAHTPETTSPAPQREVSSQQEPEENSESDVQDISGGDLPDPESAENGEVSIDPVSEPQPTPSETDTPPRPDLLQTTMTSTEVRPPQSPSPTRMNSDVTDGSSFLPVTPERPPVQDTTPPAVVLKPEETPEHPSTQVVESRPQTEAAATPSPPPPGLAGTDASLCDDGDACLSKPSRLVSFQPQNNGVHAAAGAVLQPYSGDSGRLEMSAFAPDAATSARPFSSASVLPCQENGVPLSHNQPEENHYESPCASLATQEVMTHVVHVSEEASILDLDGQSPNGAASCNGDAAEESVNTPCGEARPFSEAKTLPDSEKKTTACALSANRKYILTAAAVGACALLLARRFRN